MSYIEIYVSEFYMRCAGLFLVNVMQIPPPLPSEVAIFTGKMRYVLKLIFLFFGPVTKKNMHTPPPEKKPSLHKKMSNVLKRMKSYTIDFSDF